MWPSFSTGALRVSGEATAIAFKGRPNTRCFGTPTCGLSTANADTPIDNATLILTVGTMADRNRLVFGDSVVPDEFIENTTFQVDRAIAWLREQAIARSAMSHHNQRVQGSGIH